MKYPFEFKELLITDKVLDVLGFTEYSDGAGDFGDRRLDLRNKENPKKKYIIYEIDEIEDPEAGYGYGEPEYCSQHFCTKDFKENIYFLHEMYEDILEHYTPEEVETFIQITKRRGVNMFPYIKQYLNYKNNNNEKI